MLPPDEALRAVLGSVRPLPPREVPLTRAGGLVLADAVRAAADMPAFDNSAMDGWALRAADVRPRVTGAVMAGEPGGTLPPGTTVRLMTGAPVPAGADCVVPKEQGREEGGVLVLDEAPEPGQHVRRRGEDARAGEVILEAGRALGPFEVAMLAAQGLAAVPVVPAPRVAVVTSGDELRSPWETLGPGQVRDCSTPALAEALRGWGAVPVPVGAARDEQGELERLLKTAFAAADAVLVTGGVSVGDRDLTRPALQALGAREVFWRTAVKPGKPLLFAVWDGKPVWGLPGNPVSTLVTAEVFVRPALDVMGGRRASRRPFPERGALGAPFQKSEGLRQFVFCRAAGGVLEPIVPQNSGRLSMGTRAQALAVLPEGRAAFETGDEVEFRWL
ncbi:molybdopterin molybdenumtransferase MoeA [bacterium]|nr:MAG: molybdopterin molybdenumtransferase MoeA [bacterium]